MNEFLICFAILIPMSLFGYCIYKMMSTYDEINTLIDQHYEKRAKEREARMAESDKRWAEWRAKMDGDL